MLLGLTQKIKNNTFNNEPILTSMLAAGIVLDMFAGKAEKARKSKRRRLEATSTLPLRLEILPFLSTRILSQNTNMCICIRNVCKYTYIIYTSKEKSI